MITDREALWVAVLAAPDDAAPKLVFADWLDEQGRDPSLSAGLRWCAAYGKWPEYWLERGTWTWVSDKSLWQRRTARNSIPSRWFKRLDQRHSRDGFTRTQSHRLAVLICRLGRQLAPTHPGGGPPAAAR